jgi:hypothetical protein
MLSDLFARKMTIVDVQKEYPNVFYSEARRHLGQSVLLHPAPCGTITSVQPEGVTITTVTQYTMEELAIELKEGRLKIEC